MHRLSLYVIFLGISGTLAAQQSNNTHDGGCGAANGGGANSTNYYGDGADPCAYTYSVPAERINQLLNDARYCTMYSRTQVNCSREVKGNYGQIRLDRRDGAGMGGGNNPGSLPERSFPTGTSSAITPAQRADADRMFQRSLTLIERNQYREAIPLLLQAGRLGNARAQATLGIAYQDGNGVRRDDAAAAHWYGLAAAQGHRAAQYGLAGMYEEGEGGLPKDRVKANKLYLASANQGYDKAQLVIGMAYEVGDGVPRSRTRAIQMLRASGLGVSIANVLASPQTPARFASFAELGGYIRKLAEIENAKLNARIAANSPRPDVNRNPIDRINANKEMNDFQRARGADRPY